MPKSNNSPTAVVKTERSDDIIDIEEEESDKAKNDGYNAEVGNCVRGGSTSVMTHGMIYATRRRWDLHSLQKAVRYLNRTRTNKNKNNKNNLMVSGLCRHLHLHKTDGGSWWGHVDAGQKRKATESVTNGAPGMDPDEDDRDAPKRQKTDAMRRHSDFWHPDGSIIIHIEETEFRLHQSILQKQSTALAADFEDIREQKRSGNPYPEVEIDGQYLPVLGLDDDGITAADFATLMTVVEEPMCVATSVG